MKKSSLVLTCLILLSIVLGFADIVSQYMDRTISDKTYTLWHLIFFVLTAFWVKLDAGERAKAEPFEFGFLVYIFWPVVFPYYLIQTRKLEGLILLLGFIATLYLPWVSGLVTYVYFI